MDVIESVTEVAGEQAGDREQTSTRGLADSASAISPVDSVIGSLLGRYYVSGLIGQGGMGTVYRAEQRWPVVRPVALKMIQADHNSGNLLARFQSERQLLALMDHPDIAKVFDADTTDDGMPYFVMEYCAGETIDKFCSEKVLSTNEKIELIIRICRAMQHAHSKGIVHRDLKPANILVSHDNADTHVKVIDFGIAQALSGRHDDAPSTAGASAEQGERVGTPAFMSPEQARGEHIDARTDVFSLGATLFCLMTGEPPLRWNREGIESNNDLLDAVANFQPTPPSLQLPSGEVSWEADLDWVVMKALAPDRTERYATVLDFADDLKRYLRFEPVKAARPSRAYRLKKFIQRNRGLTLMGALVMVVTFSSLTAVAGIAIHEANLERTRKEAIRTSVLQMVDEANGIYSQSTSDSKELIEQIRIALKLLDDAEILIQRNIACHDLRERVVAARDEATSRLHRGEFVVQVNAVLERLLKVHAGLWETPTSPLIVSSFRQAQAEIQTEAKRLGIQAFEVILPHQISHVPPDEQGDTYGFREAMWYWWALNQVESAEGEAPSIVTKRWQEIQEASQADRCESVSAWAILAWHEGERSLAVKRLQHLYQRYPHDYWLNHLLGVFLLAESDESLRRQSISYLTAAVALRPDSAVARFNLGSALERLKEKEAARELFEIAFEMEPSLKD